jgi:hypothetical protein
LDAPAAEEGVARDEKRVGPVTYKACKCHIDLAAGAGAKDMGLQADRAGSFLHLIGAPGNGRI